MNIAEIGSALHRT